MKTYLVTGGAGFIGSHLVDALLADPKTERVVVIDNFSSGRREHLAQHADDLRLEIVECDLLNLNQWNDAFELFKGIDCVLHMSANPDARRGITDTALDLNQETLTTYNVLESMRVNGVKKIIFASSGTVYGDSGLTVCKEGVGERLPISLYGAGKVASEALISAFCGTFGFSSVIFRFGNVVGERTTHGCIFDFIKQLRENPNHLNVLGDGNQSKPYLYVEEVVNGLIHGLRIFDFVENFGGPKTFCEPYNLAPDGATSVNFIANELMNQWHNKYGGIMIRRIRYGESPAGWAGDVPHSRMDMTKLVATGFRLRLSSDEAVKYAIEQILKTI